MHSITDWFAEAPHVSPVGILVLVGATHQAFTTATCLFQTQATKMARESQQKQLTLMHENLRLRFVVCVFFDCNSQVLASSSYAVGTLQSIALETPPWR